MGKDAKMRIYISGKVSGIDIKYARQNFEHVGNDLRRKCPDATIINPLKLVPFLGIKIWICYMLRDLYEQSKCQRTVFLWNWKDSKGAVIEYFFAKFVFKHDIEFYD